MSTIHFFRFANGCAPKSVEMGGYCTCDVIAKSAKKNMGLAGKLIDACYDENADLKAAVTGTIFSGMRAVGRFRVISP